MTKSSYRQTEFGIMPEDWQYRPFGELLVEFKGGANLSPDDFWDIGIPVLPKSGVTRGCILRIQDSDQKFCDSKLRNKFSTSLVDNTYTIIVLRDLVPSGPNIGLIVRIKDEQEYLMAQGVYGFLLKSEIIPSYLAQLSNSEPYRRLMRAILVGSTQVHIRSTTLKETRIPLPPTKAEQEAIAKALSDTDALIESLEQLIVKKRNIKQGAMQELLTPKDGWVKKSLFELADEKKSLFDDGDWIEAEHITTEGVRLIQTGNIGVGGYVEKENKKYIFETSFEKQQCKKLYQGDLLICRLAEPAGRACVLPDIGDAKVVTSVDVTIFRPRTDVANRVYLANVFSTTEWFKQVGEMVGGTTHKRISRSALGRIRISLPEIEEQNKIANVISDMDADITVLETQLAKTRQLKQGMMHELLTGRIRLVKHTKDKDV